MQNPSEDAMFGDKIAQSKNPIDGQNGQDRT
jgi:hypothetical protein